MDLSILIPARNEEFLGNTIRNILENIEGKTEVIAVLDGYEHRHLPKDPRVTIIRLPRSIGQRAATNLACKLSSAKYVMKVDAHCAFDKGFDVKMMADMQDDWTCVPLMRNLHAFDWVCPDGHRRYQGPAGLCTTCKKETHKEIMWISKDNPQSTSYCFDSVPHFQYFKEYTQRPEYKKGSEVGLTETMSLQGSCFMMIRDKYWKLNMNDETWGSWGSQGAEIATRTWLSGGRVMVNHKTFYSHMFRTQKDFSFPYPLSGIIQEQTRKCFQNLFYHNTWNKQIYPLSWLIDRFWPVPGWKDEDLKRLKQKEMEVKRSGVYIIKNNISGKIYIGSSINITRRFKEHLKMLHTKSHDNRYLQSAWNKYGSEHFTFNIEYFCEEDKLLLHEQKYIDFYKEKIGWRNMYNLAPEAKSQLGFRHSSQSLEKMSEQQSGEKNGFYGKQHTPETIAKISAARKGIIPWNKGIPCLETTKNKISKANIGKEGWNKGLTKETDIRVKTYADKLIGKPQPWEHKGMLGKTHNKETKKIISESIKKTIDNRLRDNNGKFITFPTKGIIYYTDNQLDEKITKKCQEQLMKIESSKLPIVSVSLKPIQFGENYVLPLERSLLTMSKQILKGLEMSTAEVIFFCEHDVLYHPSHFDFTPTRKDVYYYNTNSWMLRLQDGHCLFYEHKSLSGLCAYRETLLKHYRERVRRIETLLKEANGGQIVKATSGNEIPLREAIHRLGFEPGTHNRPEKIDDLKAEGWKSEQPNVDIKHDKNWTKNRWKIEQFRDKSVAKSWKEADILPYWGKLQI